MSMFSLTVQRTTLVYKAELTTLVYKAELATLAYTFELTTLVYSFELTTLDDIRFYVEFNCTTNYPK